MPRRNARKKTKRRIKPYRRRRRRRPSIMATPSGVHTTRIVKMRYASTTNVTSTSGVIGSKVFRANSIFDPDYTGTGHQPMGHDTWESLYNHYVVLGSKISVRLMPTSTSNTAPGIAGIYLTDSTSVPYTVPSSFLEAKKGTYTHISPGINRLPVVKSFFSAKKYFNVTDVKDNLRSIGAAFGANPTESANFVIWYATLDASTQAMSLVITVDYILAVSEPKDLTQS